jgi:hypothetical protein
MDFWLEVIERRGDAGAGESIWSSVWKNLATVLGGKAKAERRSRRAAALRYNRPGAADGGWRAVPLRELEG